jgi:hypothetical protein
VTVEPQEQEPRVASLHDLMRDIGALRRSLETELTLTAAALEHDELVVADEMLGGSLQGLADFEGRGLAHLGTVPALPASITFVGPAPRVGRRLRAVAVAASFAALALVLQAAPASTNLSVSASAPPEDLVVRAATIDLNAALAAFGRLYQSGAAPAVTQISAASAHLASEVKKMSVAQRTDIATATQAITALRTERALLTASNSDGRLNALITKNEALTEELTRTLNETLQALKENVAPLQSAVPGLSPVPVVGGLLDGVTGLLAPPAD